MTLLFMYSSIYFVLCFPTFVISGDHAGTRASEENTAIQVGNLSVLNISL